MEDVCEWEDDRLAALLPMPDAQANKYSRGRLVVVAGSARYPGAACLAAAAGQRAGAGYTECVCAPESVGVLRAYRASLVVRSWEGLSTADLPASAPGKPVAYVVGPGFDAADAECVRLALSVLENAAAPVLVDGGALGALSTSKGRRLLEHRFACGFPTVATPHGGEAARLARALDLPVDDQAELARLLSLAYGLVACVKGPDTFVSDGEDVVAVRRGSAALAKAGTGDVLAGIAGALLAQGLAPVDAAVLAVTLHAEAGCLAAARFTDVSVIPEDVVEAVPDAIKKIANAGGRSVG